MPISVEQARQELARRELIRRGVIKETPLKRDIFDRIPPVYPPDLVEPSAPSPLRVRPRRSWLAGIKEHLPETVAGTAAGLVGAATLGPDPTDLVTVPATYAFVQGILAPSAAAGLAGMTARAGQQAYRGEPITDADMARAFLWQAGPEGLGRAVPFALAPLRSKVTPGLARLSEELGKAGQRIPSEQLAKLAPKIQRQLIKPHTLLPRIYKEAGKWKFGQKPKPAVFLTGAQKTVAPQLDWLENAVEGSILGGNRMYNLKRILQPTAYKQVVKEMSDSMWQNVGRRMSASEAGDLFLDAITGSQRAFQKHLNILYKQVDDLVGAYPVDMRSVKELAKQIIKEADISKGLGASRAIKEIAGKAKQIDDGLTFVQSKWLRSDVLDEVRNQATILGYKNPKVARAGQRLVLAIDDQMAETAKDSSMAAYTAWRAANKVTKTGKTLFDNANLQSATRLAGTNPEKVINKFFVTNGQKELQLLKRVIDKRTFETMRAAWIEQILRRSEKDITELGLNEILVATAFGRRFNALGEEALQIAFAPQQLNSIRDVIQLGQAISSGAGRGGGSMVIQLTQAGAIIGTATGLVEGRAMQRSAAGILLGPLGLARLFASPTGAKLLGEGLRMPRGTATATALVIKILKEARYIPEPQPKRGQLFPLGQRLDLPAAGRELITGVFGKEAFGEKRNYPLPITQRPNPKMNLLFRMTK